MTHWVEEVRRRRECFAIAWLTTFTLRRLNQRKRKAEYREREEFGVETHEDHEEHADLEEPSDSEPSDSEPIERAYVYGERGERGDNEYGEHNHDFQYAAEPEPVVQRSGRHRGADEVAESYSPAARHAAPVSGLAAPASKKPRHAAPEQES